MKQGSPLKAHPGKEILRLFTEPQVSLPCSQESDTAP
jgi:hypothetical protein